MKELKAVLFDLDGVIFDTEPQYTIFWGDICREYHPEEPRLEHRIKGSTLVQIYDRWFDGPLRGERERITRRLDAFEAQMRFDYISGLPAFVADLRSQHVKTAIVTSSNRPKMESVYRQHPDFTEMFDAILTSEDFARSKPDPDCYLRAAARLGVAPEDAVVVEDSINGLKAGRAAGMAVVGMATTLSREEIAPLSDVQMEDYTSADTEIIRGILARFAKS